jgi:hypothetical protein
LAHAPALATSAGAAPAIAAVAAAAAALLRIYQLLLLLLDVMTSYFLFWCGKCSNRKSSCYVQSAAAAPTHLVICWHMPLLRPPVRVLHLLNQ